MKEQNERILAQWAPYLDLKLPVSVEIGRSRMKLRDITSLETDSIIKLSRSTGEGVDVRIDDLSLLRGEIVVFEDKAGVRISEVAPATK